MVSEVTEGSASHQVGSLFLGSMGMDSERLIAVSAPVKKVQSPTLVHCLPLSQDRVGLLS